MARAFAAVLHFGTVRQVLGIAFDYHMLADLVTDTIERWLLRCLAASGTVIKANNMEQSRLGLGSCKRALCSR